MTADDDDYVDAFKKAKLEHDQQRKGPTEVKRLQAEADADHRGVEQCGAAPITHIEACEIILIAAAQ